MKIILFLMWKGFHGWNMFGSRTDWAIFLPHYHLGTDEIKVFDMMALSTGIVALRVPEIKYHIWMHSWEWQNRISEAAQIKHMACDLAMENQIKEICEIVNLLIDK